MNMSSKKRHFYRDAGTGQIVTKRYADQHPKTTEKETFLRKTTKRAAN